MVTIHIQPSCSLSCVVMMPIGRTLGPAVGSWAPWQASFRGEGGALVFGDGPHLPLLLLGVGKGAGAGDAVFVAVVVVVLVVVPLLSSGGSCCCSCWFMDCRHVVVADDGIVVVAEIDMSHFHRCVSCTVKDDNHSWLVPSLRSIINHYQLNHH